MRRNNDKNFWNKEYKKADHLALSTEPSEDFVKFCNYLEREHGRQYLNERVQALDLGCGNGRNLIYLAKNFGVRGFGIDISMQAIRQAEENAQGLPITFEVGSIADPIPLPDRSQGIVIDAMVNHVLRSPERTELLKEILRVLRNDGWFFFKTFLLDEDINAKMMLRDYPGSEPGSYIHPAFHVEEHVFSEEEITGLLEPYFTIHKINKSHGHIKNNRAHKRRSVAVWAQKKA